MTLKHILKLQDESYVVEKPSGCSSCMSIFEKVPWNRTCEEAGIDTHWCVCTPYQMMDKNLDIISKAVNYVLDYLNQMLDKETRSVNNEPLCAMLKLKEIMSARKSENVETNSVDFLIVFKSLPANAVLESTVRYSHSAKNFKVLGSVSRISEYSDEGSCITVNHLRKYCYCLRRKILGIF